MILKHEINSHHRQFYIDEVNNPIVRCIKAIGKSKNIFVLFCAAIDIVVTAKKYPDPHNCQLLDQNSIRLLEIWDRYDSFEDFATVKILVDTFFRGVINKNEHSPNYRDRIGFIVEELRDGSWNRRALNHPRNGWKETRPYGGKYAINKDA